MHGAQTLIYLCQSQRNTNEDSMDWPETRCPNGKRRSTQQLSNASSSTQHFLVQNISPDLWVRDDLTKIGQAFK